MTPLKKKGKKKKSEGRRQWRESLDHSRKEITYTCHRPWTELVNQPRHSNKVNLQKWQKPDILSHWDNHEQFILNWKYNVTSAIPSHAYSINRLNCVWSETWWGPLDVPSMSLRALASIGPIPRLIPISTVSGADTPWIQYQIAGTVRQTLF